MIDTGDHARVIEERNELARQNDRYEKALREIAVGKLPIDNEGPLDPYTSMAGRFLSIAQAALTGGADR